MWKFFRGLVFFQTIFGGTFDDDVCEGPLPPLENPAKSLPPPSWNTSRGRPSLYDCATSSHNRQLKIVCGTSSFLEAFVNDVTQLLGGGQHLNGTMSEALAKT